MKLTSSSPLSARLAAGLTTLVLAGSLSACTGDDSESDSDKKASANASAEASQRAKKEKPVGDVSLPCKAKIDITGAVNLSFEQPGEAIVKNEDSSNDGPLAFYTSSNPNGKTMVLLYSEGPNFKPSVTLSNNKRNFSSGTNEAKGLTASTDGSKVVAKNVVVTGTDGKAKAEVSATFTCGEKVGQKKKDKKN